MKTEKLKPSQARRAAGKTQQDLADVLCIDRSSYHRREKGEIRIHMDEWKKLAQALDLPLEEIYEPDTSMITIIGDNAVAENNGTNNIYSVPEYLLQELRETVKYLRTENEALRQQLSNPNSNQPEI